MSRPARTRISGHLRLDGWLPLHVHALLLEHYSEHPPFGAACLYARELCDPWPLTPTDPDTWGWSRVLIHAVARQFHLEHVPSVRANEYQALRELIGRVGRGVNGEPVFGPGSAGSFAVHTPEFPRITAGGVDFIWRGAGESLGQLAWRVAHALGVRRPADLPGGVYQEILDLPAQAERLGWLLSDTRSALERHLRWLFLRLCPQDVRGPWRYGRIARAAEVSEPRSVQRPVDALVELMKIDLPARRRGRPRGR